MFWQQNPHKKQSRRNSPIDEKYFYPLPIDKKSHCMIFLFTFSTVGIITKFARVNLQMYQGHLTLFKTICNDFVTLKDVIINIK